MPYNPVDVDTRTDRFYYVSVVDGPQHGFLLGPYQTHQEALDNVNRGRKLACDAVDRAWFYGFGTCSLPTGYTPLPKTVFGT